MEQHPLPLLLSPCVSEGISLGSLTVNVLESKKSAHLWLHSDCPSNIKPWLLLCLYSLSLPAFFFTHLPQINSGFRYR